MPSERVVAAVGGQGMIAFTSAARDRPTKAEFAASLGHFACRRSAMPLAATGPFSMAANTCYRTWEAAQEARVARDEKRMPDG